MGKVGTGFSDAMRKEDWNSRIGEFIEVECMQLTPDGKFRHPRFLKRRWDKNANSEG
jgi:ATP-dependent DNA ligase